MILTIDLEPQTEAGLSALAAMQGLALPQYVRWVLEQQLLASGPAPDLSPTQRAAAWRASVVGLPIRPVLSDEAVSRGSIYAADG